MGLTEAVAVAGVVVAAAGAYFAFRALSPPKREIVVRALPAVPLLAVRGLAGAGIRVTREGRDLDDPHLVTLVVENTGRHDVTRASFHEEAPIVVEVGTAIEVIQATATPPRATPFPCEASGTELRLGPGLLACGQRVVVQLLAELAPAAEPPRVRHALIDVRVGVNPPVQRRGAWLAVGSVATAGMAVTVAVALAIGTRTSGRVFPAEPFARRGNHLRLVGVGLPEFCPVTVEMFNGVVGRGQTDEDGFFEEHIYIARTRALGKTDITVTCRDEKRTEKYGTTVAVVSE